MASMRIDGGERRAERVGIVGLDESRASRSRGCQDRRGKRNGLPQSGKVVARLCPHQQPHGARAIGERGGNGFEPDLRHLVDAERQHVGGQARAVARQSIDQRSAVFASCSSRIGYLPPASRKAVSRARSLRISTSAGGSA